MIQILVVEDDELHRQLLNLVLKLDGYHIIATNTGEEALAIFACHTIDLVLLDIHLPGIDGYTVCTELRKVSSAPILLLSALTRTNDVRLGLQAGATDHLSKPFAILDLRIRIRELLQVPKPISNLLNLQIPLVRQSTM